MKAKQSSGFLREISKHKTLYIMFLPVALFYLMFAYIPMGGIVLAFKSFNFDAGIIFSKFNGLDNFKYLFTSGELLLVTKNTVLYNVLFMVCYTVFSITVAIMISEMKSKWFKKISQSFLFLPYFISWVVVSAFLYNFFNFDYGVVNTTLKALGSQPVDIYSNPNKWVILLPVLYVWKWVGYGSVLYLAAIMGIDQECYEAATIDGASMFQKIRTITLPLLKPTVVTLILLGIGRIMRGEFDMFYNLVGNNGLLFNKTDIIDTLVFRSLVGTQDFGMSAAAGFYQSVLTFIIIMGVNGIVRKVEPEYALF